MPEPSSASTPHERESVKTATIGLIISFVVVLVFRGFFLETFHIPTGSMAPTLMGQHTRFHSPDTGVDWAVNPWPDARSGVRVTDPSTGRPRIEANPRLRAGDRIAIIKYNPLYHPKRWDVVVIKWPSSPRENYIKRLIGMPGERVWLVDGDAFIADADAAPDDWSAWRIARKPERVQNALWWPLFSSERAPIDPVFDGRAWTGPWRGQGWNTEGRIYTWTPGSSSGAGAGGGGGATLTWDLDNWPITDWQPYNDVPRWVFPRFPTADIRAHAAVEPEREGAGFAFELRARGHVFRASHDGGSRAAIEMRPDTGAAAWTTLAEAEAPALPAGRSTTVEVWHVDQSLQLRIGGKAVVRADYDWDPMQRLEHATGLDAAAIAELLENGRNNPLANPAIYRAPLALGWTFTNTGALTLQRVGLDRDVSYVPTWYRSGEPAGMPALGTHPANVATLGEGHYYLLGDNSANSTDSRLIDTVDPWVLRFIDEDLPLGVIPREFMMGRAFICFWPATQSANLGNARFPFVPDTGRMRFID